VDYHLGYYAEKLGRSDAALHYRRGAAADPRCVFPHRHETERVLRRAVEVDPGDARARHFLGTLLCAKGRPDEAIRSWEGALAGDGGSSVLHRNLGRTFWKASRDADRAIPEYQQAIRLAPDDYKPYLELEKILATCGLTEQRRRLIESIPATLMGNDLIVERIAAFHADGYEFDRTLELLSKTYFFPWEVYKGVRILFVDAAIGKGIQIQKRGDAKAAMSCYREAMTYPRAIGVGEPFLKQNAEALYRTGCAERDAGDAAGARASWEQAADEPRPVPEALCYYRGKALAMLGRTKEAREVFDALADFARAAPGDGAVNAAENRYLEGLAAKGKGDAVKALRSFREALLLSPAHRRCRWELEGFAVD
jgi:tetratricopeptide (TPR) repeat protein